MFYILQLHVPDKYKSLFDSLNISSLHLKLIVKWIAVIIVQWLSSTVSGVA